MRLRSALLTGLVVALAASTSANAATKPKPKPVKPFCNVLQDDLNDEHSSFNPLMNSPALDIVSGDFASGKSELVAVLRVRNADTSNDTWATLSGFDWTFAASVNGVDYTFNYTRPAQHGRERISVVVGGAAVQTFTFSVVGNTFVWRVPRAQLASLNKKAGQKFVEIHAMSKSFSSTSDSATASPPRHYPDKAPSCVKAK